MELGMIGLGRMGANMATRLLREGHVVVGFDPKAEARSALEAAGGGSAATLAELVAKLPAPRVVWMMVPAGSITEDTLASLLSLLAPGDIVIDGGNSNYQDSMRRGALCAAKQLSFVDCGTSGGVWGLEGGYSLMVGGEKAAVEHCRPIFATLAPKPDQGWGHVGPAGAGHFTKMVHNGIEYGLMQAYAEGFAIMGARADFQLDLHQVAEIWREGSVVRSWLLDLTSRALASNPRLDGIAPYVEDSGEGRWTVTEAIALNVPAPVITASLIARLRSRAEDNFGDKLLAAMRQQFGGHAIRKE